MTEQRLSAIEELLFVDSVSKTKAERIVEMMEEKDGEGRYRQFCYVLKQACVLYIQRLEKRQQRAKYIRQAQKRK